MLYTQLLCEQIPNFLKIQSSRQYLFALLWSMHVKSARKPLMKLTSGGCKFSKQYLFGRLFQKDWPFLKFKRYYFISKIVKLFGFIVINKWNWTSSGWSTQRPRTLFAVTCVHRASKTNLVSKSICWKFTMSNINETSADPKVELPHVIYSCVCIGFIKIIQA